jgi:hypothetical protein
MQSNAPNPPAFQRTPVLAHVNLQLLASYTGLAPDDTEAPLDRPD